MQTDSFFINSSCYICKVVSEDVLLDMYKFKILCSNPIGYFFLVYFQSTFIILTLVHTASR